MWPVAASLLYGLEIYLSLKRVKYGDLLLLAFHSLSWFLTAASLAAAASWLALVVRSVPHLETLSLSLSSFMPQEMQKL